MKNGLVVNKDGDKFWYKDDKLHREDGPAVEFADGSKFWCQNNKLHRLDGPAREWADGGKYWYIQGKLMASQKEFERLIKIISFM